MRLTPFRFTLWAYLRRPTCDHPVPWIADGQWKHEIGSETYRCSRCGRVRMVVL